LLTRDQLNASTGSASNLRALAWLHLDAMHGGTHRDIAQRQAVAGADRSVAARDHLVTSLQALGSNDVATLTVNVAKQGDMGGAVGIVFDPLHARRNAFLVALEIDDAVMLLVSTT